MVEITVASKHFTLWDRTPGPCRREGCRWGEGGREGLLHTHIQTFLETSSHQSLFFHILRNALLCNGAMLKAGRWWVTQSHMEQPSGQNINRKFQGFTLSGDYVFHASVRNSRENVQKTSNMRGQISSQWTRRAGSRRQSFLSSEELRQIMLSESALESPRSEDPRGRHHQCPRGR